MQVGSTRILITDAYSRFCIRCELVEEPDALAVEHILDSAFRELGLPRAAACPGPAPAADLNRFERLPLNRSALG